DNASSASAERSRPALPEIRPATSDAVLAAVREPGAEVVLVNIWATWCAPCREEFPDLMRLNERYRDRGLRLVLISADFEDQLPLARRFLAKQGVDFPSYLKTGDDMRFINAMDSRWTGALPATLIYDGRGDLRHFWEGRASFEKFEQTVLDVLSEARASRSKEE
ncbi:MAG TPA: TlpA disulfide reductase family protein, partial [Candidatus Limnocylindria bacterium]|nr:TlpA disulfide reductase family protein [Candidatus Limnocylindria bacterium]